MRFFSKFLRIYLPRINITRFKTYEFNKIYKYYPHSLYFIINKESILYKKNHLSNFHVNTFLSF